MTRILQLVTRDEPGKVRVLTRMIEVGLQDRDIAVTTLALDQGGSIKARWAHLYDVMRLLVLGGYDAVLSYHPAAGIVAAVLGGVARIPVRAAHQTAMPDAPGAHWLLLDYCCGALGLHTAIIANSPAMALAFAHYPAAYRARLRVIAPGVRPLSPPKFPFNWRSALFIPPLAPLLVSTGRLTPQKNHLVAVAALAELPGAHLIIAGEGSGRAALMAKAEALGVAGRLHLVGYRPRDIVASLLSAADIYLFPSLWETFGLAVVEAGMIGLPIVAADLSVLRDVLAPARDHGMVLYHRPADAAGVAAAVRAVLGQYPDAAHRAASARAMTCRHGIAPMLNAYERLLDADDQIGAGGGAVHK